jgi:bifunctional non-homologous end joining protein LigD
MDKGQLEFVLKGKKLKGTFVMTRLKGKAKEWLIMKKKDEYAKSSYEIEPELTDIKLKTLKEKVPPCDTD